MGKHGVCPWWIGYLLASSIRNLWQDLAGILVPHVRAGMTMLVSGPGMGFFRLEMARLVGPSGRFVAVDVQPRMIEGLKRRARKAGLLGRIDVRWRSPLQWPSTGSMRRSTSCSRLPSCMSYPRPRIFLSEVARAVKAGARLLLAAEERFPKSVHLASRVPGAALTGRRMGSFLPRQNRWRPVKGALRDVSAMRGLPCLPTIRDGSRRQGRRAPALRLQVAFCEP